MAKERTQDKEGTQGMERTQLESTRQERTQEKERTQGMERPQLETTRQLT